MFAAMPLPGDSQIVGVAWTGAASGWLLAEVIPDAVRAVLEALSISTAAARLRATRAALIEEWGLDSVSNDQ
jgi:hypothetical protein